MNIDELDRLREEETRLKGLAWKDDFYFDQLRIVSGRLNNAFRNAAPELIAMARRYQWLRGDRLPEHSVRWMQWEISCWQAPEWTVDLRHDRLDAAIDAAMQEQKT